VAEWKDSDGEAGMVVEKSRPLIFDPERARFVLSAPPRRDLMAFRIAAVDWFGIRDAFTSVED
jgi:hypothetical protein